MRKQELTEGEGAKNLFQASRRSGGFHEKGTLSPKDAALWTRKKNDQDKVPKKAFQENFKKKARKNLTQKLGSYENGIRRPGKTCLWGARFLEPEKSTNKKIPGGRRKKTRHEQQAGDRGSTLMKNSPKEISRSRKGRKALVPRTTGGNWGD